MKLTCDLCGGALQMDMDSQRVTCQECGMGYPVELIRARLNQKAPTQQPPSPKPTQPEKTVQSGWPTQPVQQAGQQEIPQELAQLLIEKLLPPGSPTRPVVINVTSDKPEKNRIKEPHQFLMQVHKIDIGDFFFSVHGKVLQGGIGVGCDVYVDSGSCFEPYKVVHVFADSDEKYVKAGEEVILGLDVDGDPDILSKAVALWGDPKPATNAYTYPGSVWEYFSDLLAQEFPEYQVRQQRSSTLSSFVLEGADKKLVIYLLGSNSYSAREELKRMQQSVNCVHFYDDYRNDAPYVIQRIREALR